MTEKQKNEKCENRLGYSCKSKLFAYFMAIILAITLMPQSVLSTSAEEDQVDKDLKTVENYFKDKTGSDKGYIIFTTKDTNTSGKTQYGDLVKFGTAEGEYNNALVYLRAKAAELTNRDINDIKVTGKTNIVKGTYASGKPFEGTTMDKDGNFTLPKGDEFTTPGVFNTKFEIRGKEKEIGVVWFAVEPEEVTDEQKIEFEAKSVTWDAIRGDNLAFDKIVDKIGVKNSYGYMGALNFASQLYTKSVTIETKLAYVGEGEDPKAMKLDTSNNVTVKRPNVGEADASYKLTVTVKSGIRAKDIVFDLKVPAFKGYEVPISISPDDATLEITDPYYGTLVDGKYIKKDGNLITYNLHPQKSKYSKYSWKLSKPGYITKSGDFSFAEGDTPSGMKLELQQSSENDSRLKDLILKDPPTGASTIIEPMDEFSPIKKEYTLKVGSSVEKIEIEPKVYVEGAECSINGIKYYSDVDTGEETEDTNTRCFLKKDGNTKITITVTAPESSTQTDKTSVYTLTVIKSDEVFPLAGLDIEAEYTESNKNNRAEPEEEKFFPRVESGGHAKEYTAYVNYGVDSVKLTPKIAEVIGEANIKKVIIEGKEIALDAFPYKKTLKTGRNEIPVKITYVKSAEDITVEYNLCIIKKKKILLNAINVENGSLRSKEGDWIVTSLYQAGSSKINFTLDIDEDVKAQIDEDAHIYQKGERISIDAKDEVAVICTIKLLREVTENEKKWKEEQAFVASFYPTSIDYPTDVVAYLPAPGQFVNEASYCNAMATKAVNAGNMVTLGSYGGSIIYYFKDGIKNDPKNPYGIDFIVYGNAFTNNDGTTALGAAEPAAVMVSSDGVHWAELAGSLFYDARTKHDNKMVYTNPEPTFSKAVDIPWTKNGKQSGAVKVNSYHSQPYYPNPSIYDQYNKDVRFINKTYKKESMTVEGFSYFTHKPAPRYGYGDTHANRLMNGRISNEAVNPYESRHDMIFNGDGMDLSWAVGADGMSTPSQYVQTVNWIKIYNPNMYDGGSVGECSPEIVGVVVAKPKQDGVVGKSSGLKSLKINGENVTLPQYTGTINFDAKGEGTLIYEPVAEDANSNIVINDTWVRSGGKTEKIPTSKMARIIVQQGEKEPKIYTLNISNVKTIETNVELDKLSVFASGKVLKVNQDGDYEYELPVDVGGIKLKAVPMNLEAKVSIEGTKLGEKENGWISPAIMVKNGENKDVAIKVVSEDGTANKSYKVKLRRKEEPTSPQVPSSKEINVQFEFTGDTKHGENGVHSPQVWIAKKTVTVPKDSTVKYLTDKELINAGLDYATKNNGTYISKIQMPGTHEYLGEFDNGPNSGWMYRHNGKIADEGYASRVLKAGDQVKWFYTDDYTKERGYEGNWDHVNKSKAADEEKPKTDTTVEKKTNTVTSKVEIKATVDSKSGEAKATVNSDKVKEQIAELVKTAEKAKKESEASVEKTLIINVESGKEAKSIETTLPKAVIEQVNNRVDNVVIATDKGTIKLDDKTIKSIVSVGSDVSITISRKKADAQVTAKLSNEEKLRVENRPVFEVAAKKGNENLPNIRGKVEIKIPYEKAGAAEQEQAVVLYKVKDDGSLEIMPKASLENGEIAFENNEINAKVVVGYNLKQFNDSKEHWAHGNITFLAAREVINGKSAGKFDPDGQVSRAEFVQILAKLSGEKLNKYATSKFGDVDENSWYSAAVAWAAANGIVSGVGKDEFAPNAAISRQDMAVIIERYLNYKGEALKAKNKEVSFGDSVKIAGYAKSAVASMQRAGVINGLRSSDGIAKFKPEANATRAEAATMICNYLKN